MNAGEYDVNVTYAATTNYNEAFNETAVEVFKQTSGVEIGEIKDVIYPDKIVIPFTVENQTILVINISTDGAELLGYLISSDNKIIFENAPGNYTITITNKETANVEGSSDTAEFTIGDSSGELDVTVTPDEVTAAENPTFYIETPDEFTGKVNITVGNKTWTRDFNETLSIDKLAAGSYEANITFYGDDRYHNKVVTVPFDVYVTTSIISSDLTRGYNSPYDFTAKFTDNLGKPLVNTTVSFLIDDNEYQYRIDSNGVVSIALKLDVDTYEIYFTNPVTGEEASNTVDIVERIISNKDLTMYYADGFNPYNVRVVDDNGKVVGVGETVKFTINGKSYNVKTDKNGYASYVVTLAPKTYTISAEYKGYKVSNKVVVKSHFIGKKKVTVKKSNIRKKGYLGLNYNMGKYFAGKKVTLKFANKKYAVKVKSNGKLLFKVSLKVVNSLKVGKKYKYTLTYKLDSKSRNIKVYSSKLVFTS